MRSTTQYLTGVTPTTPPYLSRSNEVLKENNSRILFSRFLPLFNILHRVTTKATLKLWNLRVLRQFPDRSVLWADGRLGRSHRSKRRLLWHLRQQRQTVLERLRRGARRLTRVGDVQSNQRRKVREGNNSRKSTQRRLWRVRRTRAGLERVLFHRRRLRIPSRVSQVKTWTAIARRWSTARCRRQLIGPIAEFQAEGKSRPSHSPSREAPSTTTAHLRPWNRLVSNSSN